MCDPVSIATALGGGALASSMNNQNKSSARNAREEQNVRDDRIREETWAREDKIREEQVGSKSNQSNTKNNQTYT